MSIISQEKNKLRLTTLLGRDLGYIWGPRESGPNGAKKEFLNTGKVFLRALAKDLELRDARVSSNPGGIAVSGECILSGSWERNGIYIQISQQICGECVILYRETRKDGRDGFNRWITLNALRALSYRQLLSKFLEIREEGCRYEHAA